MKAHRQMSETLQRSFTADPSLSDRLFGTSRLQP
jgi:hypothetical protein